MNVHENDERRSHADGGAASTGDSPRTGPRPQVDQEGSIQYLNVLRRLDEAGH